MEIKLNIEIALEIMSVLRKHDLDRDLRIKLVDAIETELLGKLEKIDRAINS